MTRFAEQRSAVRPRQVTIAQWPGIRAPRLLRAGTETETLAGYHATLPGPVRARMSLEELAAAAEAIDLRGRGGAGFPFARKLRAVAEHAETGGPANVVANGEEGEPASAKDRFLLATRPHLVLDGLLLTADALGAARAVLYVSEPRLAGIAAAALAENGHAGRVEVFLAPAGYVSGEETSVTRALNGGPAKPVDKPPRPYQSGVDGRPTLVSNVETFAHLARAVRLGPNLIAWDGAPGSPGTTLVTVTPDVGGATLLEVPFGTPMRDVLGHAGVGAPRALLSGGFFGGFVPQESWAAPIGHRLMREARLSLGCAALLPLTESCPVATAADLLAYFDRENAHQCGACFNGTAAMARAVARLRDGEAADKDVEALARWSTSLVGRGACGTLDGAAGIVAGLLGVYGTLVREHLAGVCPLCAGDPHDPAETRFRITWGDLFEEGEPVDPAEPVEENA
ncbi:NADH-ubiquinone oxidoreductase-F iron-sulfur binding region domain-containing protein [Streptomyces sp. NPDC004227]